MDALNRAINLVKSERGKTAIPLPYAKMPRAYKTSSSLIYVNACFVPNLTTSLKCNYRKSWIMGQGEFFNPDKGITRNAWEMQDGACAFADHEN
jgi:hypothetical protein